MEIDIMDKREHIKHFIRDLLSNNLKRGYDYTFEIYYKKSGEDFVREKYEFDTIEFLVRSNANHILTQLILVNEGGTKFDGIDYLTEVYLNHGLVYIKASAPDPVPDSETGEPTGYIYYVDMHANFTNYYMDKLSQSGLSKELMQKIYAYIYFNNRTCSVSEDSDWDWPVDIIPELDDRMCDILDNMENLEKLHFSKEDFLDQAINYYRPIIESIPNIQDTFQLRCDDECLYHEAHIESYPITDNKDEMVKNFKDFVLKYHDVGVISMTYALNKDYSEGVRSDIDFAAYV